jgi:ParB family chromosome partitioning protein
MALDLSALEEKPATKVGTAPSPAELGKPLRLKLEDIEPDPNQPRTEKMPEEIAEIGESIKERGVKQPISVKSHPHKRGKWMINDGELRWLGSNWAKMVDIPVVVDEDFDDFDQVNANEKRFQLRPKELAVFVSRKLEEGIKKAEIARRLGKPATAITELLSLVNAPPFVEEVYSSGRCTSPKTLYELRMLAEKFPDDVQAWCETSGEVTRRTVSELGDKLKGKKGKSDENLSHDKGLEKTNGAGEAPRSAGEATKAGTDLQVQDGSTGQNIEADAGDSNDGGFDKESGKNEPGDNVKLSERADVLEAGGIVSGETDVGRDTGELTSWPKGRAVSDPDRMGKPLLLVSFEGRAAAVLLNRRPTTVGLIHIRFEDGGGDQEVAASSCTINLLTDSEK